MPWMFAHRLLPVHIRDMMALALKNPEVAKEFHAGTFVVNKTGEKSSAVP